jgi:general secretion pathway protein G
LIIAESDFRPEQALLSSTGREKLTMISSVQSRAGKGSDKGFTLVELLIVIVILGILATVTVFAVRGITDKGKTSSCAADKSTIQTAIESYFANNSTYPATLAALSPAFTADPPSTAKWAYVSTTPFSSYTLAATAGGPCA